MSRLSFATAARVTPDDTDQEIPPDIRGTPRLRPGAGARRRIARLAAATLFTGVVAGLGGMGLALLLHLVQHLAYGYSLHSLVGGESFLEGVAAAPPLRRIAVLLLAGLVAGLGWWAVHRFGRPLVSIKAAVGKDAPAMPLGTTGAHALLQIVTVALGSPLGREVAPREVGAMLAGWCGRRLGLSGEDTRILIACGAGAGLAAVYNVPLAGAVFVLEVLLKTLQPRILAMALATSVIATVVAWIGLGDVPQYQLGTMPVGGGLILWACLMGPVAGMGGALYSQLTAWARAHAPRDGRIVTRALAAFAFVGLLACLLPQLPGNGRGPIQVGLDGMETTHLALLMLAAKLCATLACLAAGAEGGLLTPGLTIGALLSILCGAAWNAAFGSTIPEAAFVLVGATAFLAVSMRMPVTAILLMLEFTGAHQAFLVPIIACTAGAVILREAILDEGMPRRWLAGLLR